ncbi:MAG: histidine--tRNA ligase [Micavibrio aeruginosavorus]|uniref:Histidine--tRNA ligase n=1 Tax=Micavibrio aeruginosavorus TaxID=349221 RepID=A0A2W5FTM2_9BACT|nr:MAG: histidine--tRNA ligase [Micavibrio aeruginosavorus]
MTDRKIYKPKPVSGFPEWLPEERIVEQRWFDSIRRVFESYGYCSIETPSVEEIDVLTAKGEVDKEIYVIERLHKDEKDKNEARLALHFDQTVPLARYVAQRFNDLVFPFKRYQMQRVWRGERPQMGRMREFYQCDIDVINVDNLPISFDAEVAAVCYEAIQSLDIGRVQLRISNRKIISGFLEEWGVPDITVLLRILDKLEKVGEGQTFTDLNKASSSIGIGDNNVASMLIGLSKIKVSTSQDLKKQLDELRQKPAGPKHLEGIEELCFVLDNLSHLPEGAVVADLSIVRGLDYYTGTVYETQLLDVPEFTGSVCSGGRYDDLASGYINKHLPGVGISIGFSRLFDVMRQTHKEKLGIGPKSPADIMMVLPSEEERSAASATARQLRERGYKVEMYHAARKLDDQLKYAIKKQIPYVWLPFADGHQIKKLATREQIAADAATWMKPE